MAEIDRHGSPSQLFTIRLWAEDLGEGRREYRGQAKHVVSGVIRNFRDWADLEAFLIVIFDNYEEDPNDKAHGG